MEKTSTLDSEIKSSEAEVDLKGIPMVLATLSIVVLAASNLKRMKAISFQTKRILPIRYIHLPKEDLRFSAPLLSLGSMEGKSES